jgi:CDP-diacylglycerol--glycerol-3-phosphate 3-phosphatidyltransferase
MKQLPFLLIYFRLALAPLLLYFAYQGPEFHGWIVICCYLALISDIFDGIIARHYGVSSAKLRLWDSNVDLIFWMCACWCIWVAFPAAVSARWVLLIPFLLIEWIPDLIYFIRFRKFGCAHNYLSKTFGIFLLINFTLLFGFHQTALLSTTVVIGLLSQLDRIAISLILPNRVCDVPSAYHASLIRKGIPFKKYKLFHE